MKPIHTLEIHLVHACNLACESCSHYSNQGHRGVVSLDEAQDWMTAWHQRLRPTQLHLLGGEPTLHPQLAEFILLTHVLWPESHLVLKTNGFFLHRHPDLPMVLKATGTTVSLSIHHADARYREKIQPALELLEHWQCDLGIHHSQTESYRQWTRRYRGDGAAMTPFADGQPRASWEHCPARYHQLFEGNLWKCAPLAYLKLQDAKYGLSEQWQPYLKYRPLGPDCTDEQLDEFFAREEESYCAMCSARPEQFDLPMPLRSLRLVDERRDQAESSPSRAILSSRVDALGLPLDEDPESGWRPYPIHRGRTVQQTELGCHVSVLSPGCTPHAPHQHAEEEILIVLSGEVELQIVGREIEGQEERIQLLPRSFVYYPAGQLHTLRNPGPQPAEYLMFKWQSSLNNAESGLRTQAVSWVEPLPTAQPAGLQTARLLEGPTRYLHRLHCHATTLEPGAGYPPHADPCDVAIVTLAGTVETLGQRVAPFTVISCAAGEPHGMRNVGDEPAVYLVFEFHGVAQREDTGPAALPLSTRAADLAD